MVKTLRLKQQFLESEGAKMKNTCRKGIGKITVFMLVVLVLLSVFTGCSTDGMNSKNHYDLDVVNHTSDFYVNDFAGVFSETQKSKLMQNAVNLSEEYSGIQVVITTVESLGSAVVNSGNNSKFTIEEVGYSMYSEYGIGKDDMGILILFSTGDREVRIETGRNMQFYITDSISGRLLDDYGMDYFRDDKFAEGLISVQSAVIAEIKSEVPSNWSVSSKTEENEDSDSTENAVGAVTEDLNTNSKENVVSNSESKEKEPANSGILWGFFGSIGAALAAIGAFIYQKFKGKTDKENLEISKQEEIDLLRTDFQEQLEEKERSHELNISSIRSDYQSLIREKEDKIKKLEDDLSRANSEFRTLKTQYEDRTEKYNRAQRLHPEFNFEKEINEMIENEYKADAAKVDARVAEVLKIQPTKDNYEVFSRAIILLDTARPEVKKYITSDKECIQNLYNQAVQLKKDFDRAEQEKRDKAVANEVYNKIKKVLEDNPKGNYETYKDLNAALAIFLGLTVAQKAFFKDHKLIEKLNELHDDAEDDYNDFEKAKKAEVEVEDIIGGMYSADEDDICELDRAMGYYKCLTVVQQVYFSTELLSKLKKLISDAENDHRRRERQRDEERRRRSQQMMRTSSYSSSHRSSFGGFGGRPGGGGASRRF